MSISTNNKKVFNEINITPLTDIFLVLLIIMMVVAPSFQSVDNSIEVPEINSGVSIEQKNATVSISKEGIFYLNGVQLDSENLSSELVKLAPSLEKKEVVVKADSKTKNSEIMKVMKAAQDAEFQKFIIAGEPLSKKEQKKLEKDNSSSDNIEINVEEKPAYDSVEQENSRVGEMPSE